jgi:hypothetical protein
MYFIFFFSQSCDVAKQKKITIFFFEKRIKKKKMQFCVTLFHFPRLFCGTLSVTSAMLVSELKQLISENQNRISVENLQLYSKTKSMLNHKQLSDYIDFNVSTPMEITMVMIQSCLDKNEPSFELNQCQFETRSNIENVLASNFHKLKLSKTRFEQ